MLMPTGTIVVSEIAGKRALLKLNNSDGGVIATLTSMGFVWDGPNLTKPIMDKTEREELVRKLILLKALFAGGPDWSPAQLVEYYREQGLVNGSFLRIAWKSPDEYLIAEC